MSEVSAKIGLTLKLFKDSSYEFIRPEISIDKIDTSRPIKPQIDEAVKAIREVWDATTEEMNKILADEMPQVNAAMEVQIAKKMKRMEETIKSLDERIAKLTEPA
jgi:phage host-nuclease inhibitor protein Gam